MFLGPLERRLVISRDGALSSSEDGRLQDDLYVTNQILRSPPHPNNISKRWSHSEHGHRWLGKSGLYPILSVSVSWYVMRFNSDTLQRPFLSGSLFAGCQASHSGRQWRRFWIQLRFAEVIDMSDKDFCERGMGSLQFQSGNFISIQEVFSVSAFPKASRLIGMPSLISKTFSISLELSK